jgi:hypothetical protein
VLVVCGVILLFPPLFAFSLTVLHTSFCFYQNTTIAIFCFQLGSAKLLDEPSLPGSGYKALNQEGYDDGGVADLTLVIDLDDSVLRRKRGETDYFSALKNDLLPRVTKGIYAHLPRREQKIRLAKLLFSDEEHEEDKNPSEVWMDTVDGDEDAATKKLRLERLNSARMALSLSSVLREPACASLSLSEISKRRLACYGKEGAEDALRCADKAVEIAGTGFWDRDEIEIEVCCSFFSFFFVLNDCKSDKFFC